MEHLKSNTLTEMDGNPPIYITKRRTQQGEEIYVNNAMILKSRSNVDLKNEHGKRQVRYVDWSTIIYWIFKSSDGVLNESRINKSIMTRGII